MKHLPLHLRPREKLHSLGAENMTTPELFALLLGTGVKGRSVGKLANTLSNILHKKGKSEFAEHIVSIRGIGTAKTATILAALELGKRLFAPSTLTCITSPESIIPMVGELVESRQEHLIAFYLNARSELIHKALISKGTATASIAHPRDILWPAIEHGAVQIILVHNHPSGSLIPSAEDLHMTKNIRTAAEMLGFILLDHIIVSREGFRSIG